MSDSFLDYVKLHKETYNNIKFYTFEVDKVSNVEDFNLFGVFSLVIFFSHKCFFKAQICDFD